MIKPPVLGWMLLLWLLRWMMSASATNFQDLQSDETIDERIHHHNNMAASISSMKYFERLPLENHQSVESFDDAKNDIDVVHYSSLTDKININSRDIMMTGDRSLQISSFNCVQNETEFRFAIHSAPDFSSKSTRIDLCSPYIFIDSSQHNGRGIQGIVVINKFLEIHCSISDSLKNCVLDAQNLSRIFVVINSTLVFHNVDFINCDATKDIAYSSGGAFYVYFSTIKMFNCGFINNIATSGAGMVVFDSNITIMENDNNKIPIIIKNNMAVNNGGFIQASNSSIYLQKCNIVNNTAKYGGAVAAFDSRLTLAGSDEKTSPTIVQNNSAKGIGGCIYADNSIIEISKYNIMNNNGTYGGALWINNSSLTLLGSDDQTLPSVAQNNVAFEYGGVIVAVNSILDIRKYNIINNTAINGGALYVINTTLKLEGSDNFTMPTILENNVAINMGGVIAATSNSTIMTSKGYFHFRHNMALQRGGGAVVVENAAATFSNVVFENNIGTRFGGAILGLSNGRSKETSMIVMSNVILSNNTSLNGTIAIQETKIQLEGVAFSRSARNVDSYDLFVSTFDDDDDDDDDIYRYSQINFPNSQPPQKENLLKQQKENPIQQRACVASGSELIYEVDNCNSNESGPSCSIGICGRLIIRSRNNNGINITNKNIILSCQKECPTQQCILDGIGDSRIFYGSNTILTVSNIIFANGFHPDNGGAIKVDRSVVTIVNCSFVKNTAPFGSAVTVNNSMLTVTGLETNIVNNTGTGPPFEILSSQFSISNAVFAYNNVADYASAILAFNSSMEVYDVHYVKSPSRQGRRYLAENVKFLDDCDVHVSVHADDFSRKFSCLKFANSNKSVPEIVVPDDCSTISPPPPFPNQTFPPVCFSGENLIEIKDFGHIQMGQLRIGDFVKSNGDKFSQVYGFGHFNRDQEGTYLRITFSTNDKNRSTQIPEYFIEISPRHLLLMEKNQKQIPIPADNVVVGDILSGKTVIKIQAVIRRGVYAPLTQSGDIVVSGILASNYVNALDYDANQHMLGHFLFTPQRVFCQYHLDTCKNEIYINGYGILAYFIVLGSWIINGCQRICQLYLQCFKDSFGFFFPTTMV